MKRPLSLIYIFLFILSAATCQDYQSSVDSLTEAYHQSSSETKLNILNELIDLYFTHDVNSIDSLINLEESLIQANQDLKTTFIIRKDIRRAKYLWITGMMREASLITDSLIMEINQLEKNGLAAEIFLTSAKIKDDLAEYEVALDHCEQALKILAKKGYSNILGDTYNTYALILFNMGDLHDKSFQYMDSAMSIFAKTESHAHYIRTIFNKGHFKSVTKGVQEAMEYYFQALITHDTLQISMPRFRSQILNNIGVGYSRLGEFNKALPFLKEALDTKRIISDKLGEAIVLQNIATCYEEDSALYVQTTMEALLLYKELEDPVGIAETSINLGDIHLDSNKFDQAKPFLLDGYHTFLKIGSQNGIFQSERKLGIMHLKLGEFEQAQNYFDSAMERSQDFGFLQKWQINMDMSSYYDAVEDLVNSINYFKIGILYRDSLSSENVQKNIDELEAKYESEKQKQQISLLESENRIQKEITKRREQLLLYTLITIIATIIAITIIVRLYLLARRERQNAIDEKRSKEAIYQGMNHNLKAPLDHAIESGKAILQVWDSNKNSTIDQLILNNYQSTVKMHRNMKNILAGSEKSKMRDLYALKEIGLAEVVEETFAIYQPIAEKNLLKLESKITGNETIIVHQYGFELAFQNLIANAIAYSLPDTTIEIKVDQSKEHISLAITNRPKPKDLERLKQLLESHSFLRHEDGTPSTGLRAIEDLCFLFQGSMDFEIEDNFVTLYLIAPIQQNLAA